VAAQQSQKRAFELAVEHRVDDRVESARRVAEPQKHLQATHDCSSTSTSSSGVFSRTLNSGGGSKVLRVNTCYKTFVSMHAAVQENLHKMNNSCVNHFNYGTVSGGFMRRAAAEYS